MRRWKRYRAAFGLSVCLLSLTAHGETQPGPSWRDGFVSSEMTLETHTLNVRFVPTLRAEDPAYRALLTPTDGATGGRVHVAQLESDATLRIDTLEMVAAGQSGVRCDLWLTVSSDGWQLLVTDSGERGAAILGTVRLSHTASAVVAPTLVAVLIGTGRDTGQLVLRWGEQEWTADVQVGVRSQDQAERRAPVVGNAGDSNFDAGAFGRAQRFSTRNETALLFPDGQRLSVLFPKALTVDGRDFPHIGSVTAGSVIHWAEAAVTRLKTDVPLRFGRVTVNTGNVAPDFAGAYGLWLRRTGQGWRLVFNNEPDAWGTQHDPAFDAAEIELSYSDGGAPSRPFAVALVPTGADRGRLLMHWGPHDWFADFVVDV